MEDKIKIFQKVNVGDELSYRFYPRGKTYVDEVERYMQKKEPKYYKGNLKIMAIYYNDDEVEDTPTTLKGIDLNNPEELEKVSFDIVYNDDESDEQYRHLKDLLLEEDIIYDKPLRDRLVQWGSTMGHSAIEPGVHLNNPYRADGIPTEEESKLEEMLEEGGTEIDKLMSQLSKIDDNNPKGKRKTKRKSKKRKVKTRKSKKRRTGKNKKA